MKNQKGFTVFELLLAFTILLVVIGWIANVVKLVMYTSFDPISAMAIARIIGIFVAPLGAVLGYIPT